MEERIKKLERQVELLTNTLQVPRPHIDSTLDLQTRILLLESAVHSLGERLSFLLYLRDHSVAKEYGHGILDTMKVICKENK